MPEVQGGDYGSNNDYDDSIDELDGEDVGELFSA